MSFIIEVHLIELLKCNLKQEIAKYKLTVRF